MKKMIFEPIEINGMLLKNRVGLAPLHNMPDVQKKLAITEKTIKWFETRAKGGAGLIMTGAFPVQFIVDVPEIEEMFTRLADAVHPYDAKIAVQIVIDGPLGGIGPSPPPYPDERHPKESVFNYFLGQISSSPGVKEIRQVTVEELEQHTEAFAAAAKILKATGIDAIEFHCAHGGSTLGCAMISPFYNRRQDEYGGNWENRLRFPTNVIRMMRKSVGPDFPLIVRLSADELLGEDGITLEDTCKYVVPAMENAGVDCFDISQGSIMHSPEGISIPLYYPRGCYIHNAEAVKKITNLPVIGVGRIVDLDMAEKFLLDGKADIIHMGRQLTSDPDSPNKYYDGRINEIRKCIGCLEGCGTPCPINYDIFPDAIPLVPAAERKKILIIGGGIAGMEAARICALRGHSVTLMEKSSDLGGTVAAVARDPLTAEFKNLVDYLSVQMRKLFIDVRVCKEAGPTDIEALDPEVVILATGASLRIPKIAKNLPGVIHHIDALKHRKEIGQNVVIWGLMYGAEMAISLAKEGKNVILMGEAGENTITGHATLNRSWYIRRKLLDVNFVRANDEAAKVSNPKVLLNISVENITSDGIHITDKQGGHSTLAYDTLIISRGREKNDSVFKKMSAKGPEVHKIGDCAVVGNIQKAIWSANELARKI